MKFSNIYSQISANFDAELFTEILHNGKLTLKRIISAGHCTPAGEWYDQSDNEWVMLLKGSAVLLIEGQAEPVVMSPGDHIVLPAHVRHRVEKTSVDEKTIWLALHY